MKRKRGQTKKTQMGLGSFFRLVGRDMDRKKRRGT